MGEGGRSICGRAERRRTIRIGRVHEIDRHRVIGSNRRAYVFQCARQSRGEEEVGLDASTLSRRLVALEESLGTRLFDRTREGLQPTEGADLLLPAAEEMAAAHARFARDASGFERVAEGTVRLSVLRGLPNLSSVRRSFGCARGIRVLRSTSTRRFASSISREADLAIRTMRPQTGELVSVKLGERQWMPMVASHLAKKMGPVAHQARAPDGPGPAHQPLHDAGERGRIGAGSRALAARLRTGRGGGDASARSRPGDLGGRATHQRDVARRPPSAARRASGGGGVGFSGRRVRAVRGQLTSGFLIVTILGR